MKLLVTLIFLILGLAVLSKMMKKTAKEEKWPYYAKKPLSNPEQILYFRLINALPDHIVLAQVGLSQILGVKKGYNFGTWFNRINRLTADFVICTKDAKIIAVIELDDSTHNRRDRKETDAKKDKALKDAEINIIRWHVKAIPDSVNIQKQLLNHYQQNF